MVSGCRFFRKDFYGGRFHGTLFCRAAEFHCPVDRARPICYKSFMRTPGTVLKTILGFCLLLLFCGAFSVSEKRIYQLSPAELDILLPTLQREFPGKNERLKVLADLYQGASPYCADPLSEEQKDWFPFKETNCTLLVLYVTAFLNSSSMAEAREHMRLLHYRGGRVGFKDRYHFTADRITDPKNRYFTVCTAACLKDPKRLKKISLVLNRRSDGKSFFNGRLDHWKKKVVLDYLPREGFSPDMLKPLPDAVGVAFIKKANWEKGIIVGHEGLLIDGDLYHSSPPEGVQVVKNYLSSVFPDSGWEGLVFFNINEVFPSGGDRKNGFKRGCSMVSPLK